LGETTSRGLFAFRLEGKDGEHTKKIKAQEKGEVGGKRRGLENMSNF